jgi:hypothetical protein
MSRLIEQLGPDYLNEFCRGTLITDGDFLYNIRRVHDDHLECFRVSLLDGEDTQWVAGHSLSTDKLDSFSSLAWPKLGYRNFENVSCDNLVVFVTANRSVLRGLHSDQLAYDNLPIFQTLEGFTYSPQNGSNYKLRKIFRPHWIQFKEGMNRIREGEICGFALNEDVAISLSATEGPNRYCDIYFRQRVAGEVSESGEIVVANKVIKRANLKKLSELLMG